MVNDKDSVAWFKKFAFNSVKQKLGLACFDKGSGKIVGVNFLYVVCKDDERVSDQLRAIVVSWCCHSFNINNISLWNTQPQQIILRTWLDTIFTRNAGIDLFTKYNVDKILTSVALAVDPDYTKRGIAMELLLAR